jgi:hypothetical protein
MLLVYADNVLANSHELKILREVWATFPCDYVKNAIKTVEGLLADDGEGTY